MHLPDQQALNNTGASPAIVLSIAGFDPVSGAGFTADLKVFAAHRLYGVAAATALTVQSTRGVLRSQPVDARLLQETIACLADDLPLAGIKIGMLATPANVEVVAGFLDTYKTPGLPVVLDPVLCSSSGHALLEPRALDCLRKRLLPLVTCITPNTSELRLLAGESSLSSSAVNSFDTREIVEEAALRVMAQLAGVAIVATGGHLKSPDDCVLASGAAPVWLPGEWVQTPATHGTGCGYSSALLCQLVAGKPLVEAARAAKRYVTEALLAAEPIGHGGGSMHHLYSGYPSYQQASRATDAAVGNRTREDLTGRARPGKR